VTEASGATAGPRTAPGWWSSAHARVWALIASLAWVAVALFFGGVRHLELAVVGPEVPWWVLLAGFVVAELLVVYVRLGPATQALSLVEVPLIAALYAFDPVALVVVRVVAALYVKAVHWRQKKVKLAFNVVWAAVETQVALLVWHGVVGEGNPLGPRGWLATLAAIGVMDLLSSAAIAGVIALSEGRAQRGLWRYGVAGGAFTVIANTGLGIVIVTMLAADWRSLWAAGVVGAVLVIGFRAYHSVQVRHDNVASLYRFTRSIGVQADAGSVARVLAEHARELSGAGIAEVMLKGSGAVSATRLLLMGDGEPVAERPAASCLADLCTGPRPDGSVLYARGRQPAALRAAGLRDALVVQLTGETSPVGTILVAHGVDDHGAFDATHVTLLETLANHASVALENARLVEDLKAQVGVNRHQALHDTLTGLPNRRLFTLRIADCLAEHGDGAVLVLGLDGFKNVNDTLGHEVGDRVLQEVGARLQATLSAEGTVARLGGDEFALLLPGLRHAADAVEAAGRVHAALQMPAEVGELRMAVGASIGIALAPHHGADADVLLQRGDAAMYMAKERGRSTEVYDGELDRHNPRRLELGVALQVAVAARDLTLHYQPKIDLQSRDVVGVEALLRWQHPDHGFVPPDEFIPIAEQTGLIVPITDMVLEMALRQCRAWHDMGLALGMAVNVATQCLLDGAFPERVEALLAGTGVAPQSLTLELTETGMLTESARTKEVIMRLHAIGVALSIDDFGTGHSSLSRLRQLPVQELKVDRSFVGNMLVDADDDAVTRSTIDLGRNLGLRVVAEGIEDEATLERLRQLGCDAGQGFGISRPVDAGALQDWLERTRSAPVRPTPTTT
jgi:diguanylate cyclase (GGDEF)-like protein